GIQLSITLWGSIATELGIQLEERRAPNVVLVMTTGSAKEWKGNLTMNFTYATKTYLNLEILEAAKFSTRYKSQVDVQDETGFIKVIMFDSQLQMLINNTAKKTKDLSE
ncbi:hypothetical protein GIB67_033465, partial [Kingdonia uniflora]